VGRNHSQVVQRLFFIFAFLLQVLRCREEYLERPLTTGDSWHEYVENLRSEGNSFPMEELNDVVLKSHLDSKGEILDQKPPEKFKKGSILYRREDMGKILVVQSVEIALKTNTILRFAQDKPPFWRWYVLVMEIDVSGHLPFHHGGDWVDTTYLELNWMLLESYHPHDAALLSRQLRAHRINMEIEAEEIQFLEEENERWDTGLNLNLIEAEKVEFIRRSITQIFQEGTFPQIFQAEVTKLTMCGCSYGTSHLYWGMRVGMMCKITHEGYEENCGKICTTPKGEFVLLLCPKGWVADCPQGCLFPEFESRSTQVDFLNDVIAKIIATGYDFIDLDQEYLRQCGCVDQEVKQISYGTKIGQDCVTHQGARKTSCKGHTGCRDEYGRTMTLFCPAGYEATCEGCINVDTPYHELEERYEWAVNVLTGFIQDTHEVLDLDPHHNHPVSCGCKDTLKRVTYGNRIGYYCAIDDPEDVKEACGANVICDNGLEDIVHFCPSGFHPDCALGCGYYWKSELKQEKDEL